MRAGVRGFRGGWRLVDAEPSRPVDAKDPPPAGAEDAVADGIHAVMQAMKPPARDASSDRAVGQPERAELPSRDHAVLAVGERRDRPIRMGCGEIWPHSDHFSPHLAHARSIAKQMCQRTPQTHQSTADAVP